METEPKVKELTTLVEYLRGRLAERDAADLKVLNVD